MRRIGIFFLVVSVFLLVLPAAAQELPKAEKRENTKYYQANLVKFKAGKADEAYGYIYDHFVPVDKKIGRKIISFDFQSGNWDHVVYFPLEEGPGELGWITSPTEEKWWVAFAEQEGGVEKAQEMMQKFQATIAASKSEIAHMHLEILQQ